MKCQYCLAESECYFHNGKCRRCIGQRYEHEPSLPISEPARTLSFEHSLTVPQIDASRRLCQMALKNNVVLEAVCGAGKTEMCLELIQHALANNLRIGWATPRKEIVKELGLRFSSYFKEACICTVYGGNTDNLNGDFHILTTHQLFRFHQYFDIVILDEPDAFPFKGNACLMGQFLQSTRRSFVLLSATYDPGQFDTKLKIQKLNVDIRPSLKPVIVPEVTYSVIKAIVFLVTHRKEKILIFVPTKQEARLYSNILRCKYVTSGLESNDASIAWFRRCRSGFLVTTTVLERGVTFHDCFVLVVHADHAVFDTASLVQIAGRVGRGINPKKGRCLFYCTQKNMAVKKSVSKIKRANDAASALGYW